MRSPGRCLLPLILAIASCGVGNRGLEPAGAPPGPAPFADAAASAPMDASAPEHDASGVDSPDALVAAETVEAAAPVDAGVEAAPEAPEGQAWCPDGIETLSGTICAVVPDGVAPDPAPTLVIFLHGVIDVGSGWQIALIQGMARYAQHQHFALLAPRAPLQTAVAGKADAYAWRTSTLPPGGEDAMLNEWVTAKETLESRMGHAFGRVFVMGFSSGAYYASSLALRGRLPVDGYAVFAGGSAPYSRGMLSQVKQRAPIFVGYGLRDKTATRDARGLVAALRAARWNHRVMAARRAGHTITTAQFTTALSFLRAQAAAGAGAPPPAANAGTAPPARPRHKGSKRRKR